MTTNNLIARQAALQAVEAIAVQPSALIEYQSHGRVLIIGEHEPAIFALSCLENELKGQILQTDTASDADNVTIPLADRSLVVQGHLGNFTIRLGEANTPAFQTLSADIILDLQPEPALAMAVKPPGYQVCSTDYPSIEIACAGLSEMTGTFEKPRFFDYDPAICAHARSGQPGCSNCINACPAEAIISLREQIEVDPYLCQGGGACATVCPTGAIRYVYPPLEDQINRLRLLLKTYLEAGGESPVVVIVSESESEQLPGLSDNHLLFVVEELASVGVELWLGALAFGARQVILWDQGVPESVRPNLNNQIHFAVALLEVLGHGSTGILIGHDLEALPVPGGPLCERATYAGQNDKRNMLYAAIDALHGGAVGETHLLPVGAPMGRVLVDSDKCTLCMACTSVCPASALVAGGERPALLFQEINCVQCGICHRACPEAAIQLEPRVNLDRDDRRRGVVINEQQPFLCVSCGKPFATRNVIDAMLEKLADHHMFQTERALRRLKMCDDCRVVDVVQDDDMMGPGN